MMTRSKHRIVSKSVRSLDTEWIKQKEEFIMQKHKSYLIVKLFLCILMTTLPFQKSTPAYAADVSPIVQPATAPLASLELSVSPTTVRVGEPVTLNIAYHNIGLVYTQILMDPPGVVTFDPPLSMPCKYDSHPNGCKSITMRATAPGTVTITASATGEIYDPACTCFYFSGASSTAPVRILVYDRSIFLPFTQR